MKMRFIATLAMAATAAAIGLAPVAAAAPTGTLTTNTGGATVVQSPGNAQVTAQPGAAAVQAGQLQYPFFGGRDSGHRVPSQRPPSLMVEHGQAGGESLPPDSSVSSQVSAAAAPR